MLGKTISEKRKELGLTQAQVAEQLGVTAPAVNRWEKDLSYPDATLLAPLARLLRTDLNELFSFYHSLSDKERKLYYDNVMTLLFLQNDDEAAFAYMDEKVRENLSDGVLIKSFAEALYCKHTMLMAANPQIYLDRVVDYYEKALVLLPEESEDISYQLTTIYGELGQENKAEEAWKRLADKEIQKDWIHAELMYLLRQYDKAVPEMEENILRKAVELAVHLDTLRDTLTQSGNEELSNEAGNMAIQLRKLFCLCDAFEDMSRVSQSAAASDEEGVVNNIGSLIMRGRDEANLSTHPVLVNVKSDPNTVNKGTMDYMADILGKFKD